MIDYLLKHGMSVASQKLIIMLGHFFPCSMFSVTSVLLLLRKLLSLHFAMVPPFCSDLDTGLKEMKVEDYESNLWPLQFLIDDVKI